MSSCRVDSLVLLLPADCLVSPGGGPAASSAGSHSLSTCRKESDTFLWGLVPSAPIHTLADVSMWSISNRHILTLIRIVFCCFCVCQVFLSCHQLTKFSSLIPGNDLAGWNKHELMWGLNWRKQNTLSMLSPPKLRNYSDYLLCDHWIYVRPG